MFFSIKQRSNGGSAKDIADREGSCSESDLEKPPIPQVRSSVQSI